MIKTKVQVGTDLQKWQQWEVLVKGEHKILTPISYYYMKVSSIISELHLTNLIFY